MNILVVAHYQGDGSPSAIFIHDQIRAYLALGHRVRVLTPIAIGKVGWDGKRFGGGIQQAQVDGADYCFMRYLSLSKYGDRRFNTARALGALERCYRRLVKDFTPDVIHAHTIGFDSDLGAYLKKKLGCPLVVTTHGSDVSVPFERGTVRELANTCNCADSLVAVGAPLAEKLRASGTSTPISVILNGYNGHNSYVSFPETFRNRESVIQVGHLIQQKHFDTTIEAFAEVLKKHPKATLTIIGKGSEQENLEAQCKELGITDAVVFLGEIPNADVMKRMAQSKFFVMPSVREGFGIVYLEAMASGCITIGTEGEGIADFIEDGVNGFLVPPDQPDVISQKILWCLEHPEKAEEIARRGMEKAQGQTWEKNANEYVELFDFLIRKGKT